MKRTPIGFDAATAIGDVLGVPEGSSWQFAGTPADNDDAAPAVTTVSAVESGIDVHAAGIDLQVNVPANDILFAAADAHISADADIVSIWASPPSQPAETQIVGFGVTVAASQAQEESADQIDTLTSQHPQRRDYRRRRLRRLPSFRRCPRIWRRRCRQTMP